MLNHTTSCTVANCHICKVSKHTDYEAAESWLQAQVGGDHYKSLLIQPIEYILANNLGWCEGNAIKYITRYKMKGQGKDIEKAIHYLQILLERISDAELERINAKEP